MGVAAAQWLYHSVFAPTPQQRLGSCKYPAGRVMENPLCLHRSAGDVNLKFQKSKSVYETIILPYPGRVM